MPNKRILYISGSGGLGHITRDLAIAREMRKLRGDLDIVWLAGHTASRLIAEAGETLLPEADRYVDDTAIAEQLAGRYRLNLVRYARDIFRKGKRNFAIFQEVTRREQFDVVVGDETYELVAAFKENPALKTVPFVMIYDFVGLDAVTANPMEKLGVYMINRRLAKGYPHAQPPYDLGLFIGELEDVPDRPLGFLLPNRRSYAKARYRFLGYVLPFDVAECADRDAMRTKLGYGKQPLIVCAIGGTAIGKGLLELCGQAYLLVRRAMPHLHMALVCGPRLSSNSLCVPPDVEVKGYVPSLHEHFAASDLAIVQAGGTTTLELTALRRPFIFFPLEGHCEQEVHVAARLARHRAGIRMSFSETTPELLAEKVIENLGQPVDYAPIPTDGARRAAELILGLV